MEFSPDGEMLATGDRNGGAYVWEADTGGIVFTLGDHKDAITGLSWRADSQMLATASEDGRVILWYAEDGFPTRTINAQADGRRRRRRGKLPGVLAVQYARNGQLVTCGRDNTARIWKADGSQVAQARRLHRPAVAGGRSRTTASASSSATSPARSASGAMKDKQARRRVDHESVNAGQSERRARKSKEPS